MWTRRRKWTLAALAALLALGATAWGLRGFLTGALAGQLDGEPRPEALRLPPGFEATLYTDQVPNARSLARGPTGVVFVGSRAAGAVYAVVDRDGDRRVDAVHVVLRGRTQPNGVAYRDGDLYVAETERILRLPDIDARLAAPPPPEVVYETFPTGPQHQWKYLAFGPDGWLYVAMGAPCNVCERDDERFASILRLRPDGGGLEVFARGVRNSVGFTWHPATGEMWFTDNGRDWLGDDAPPDELNHAPRAGLHFGFPYCHGGSVPDPDFDRMGCDEIEAPRVELPAHVAALGLRFYPHDAFGERYRGGLFIAQHGSWNRTAPTGYRVAFVPFVDGAPGEPEVFASGWLDGPVAWGRPVDVLPLDDGSLLISDDGAGAIYRVTRR